MQVLDVALFSGAWPVLCVYKHSYQLSRRAGLEQNITVRLRNVCGGDRKVSVLEGA